MYRSGVQRARRDRGELYRAVRREEQGSAVPHLALPPPAHAWALLWGLGHFRATRRLRACRRLPATFHLRGSRSGPTPATVRADGAGAERGRHVVAALRGAELCTDLSAMDSTASALLARRSP